MSGLLTAADYDALEALDQIKALEKRVAALEAALASLILEMDDSRAVSR